MIRPDFTKRCLHAFFASIITLAAMYAAVLFHPGFAFASGGAALVQEGGIPLNQSARALGQDTALSKGKFLVAARDMRDPRFRETVILLVSYDKSGALGLIINVPTRVGISSVLPKIKELRNRAEKIFIGGPVSGDQLFLLIRTDKAPEGSFHVFGHTYLNGSMEALKQVARDRNKGNKFRVFMGYAGWAGGQLEREVAMGSWYVIDADEKLVFAKDTSDIWERLISRHSGIMVKLLPDEGRQTVLSSSD